MQIGYHSLDYCGSEQAFSGGSRLTEVESRVIQLEKEVAILNERTNNHALVIAEIKGCLDKFMNKLDDAIRKPSWTVTTTIALLSSATVGLLVFAVSK